MKKLLGLTVVLSLLVSSGCGAVLKPASQFDEALLTTTSAAVVTSQDTEPATEPTQNQSEATTRNKIKETADSLIEKSKGKIIDKITDSVSSIISDDTVGDAKNNHAETTTVQSTSKSSEAIKKEFSYHDVIIFDDLEITFDNDVSWTKLDNKFSENHGMDVFHVPVTIKNNKESTHSLNQFYYKQFGSNGTELDNVGYYFDGEVTQSGDMRNGATKQSFMAFLYDGDGDYYIEFSKFFDKSIEVKIPITQGDNPLKVSESTTTTAAAAALPGISSTTPTYGDTITFDDLEITFNDDVTWTVLNNKFSDNDGAIVFLVPIMVKNLKSESHNLNMFYYKQYGVYGTQLNDLSMYFDGDIAFAGDMRSGAKTDAHMTFLYDGDGDYYVEFATFLSDTVEVRLPIKK